MFLLFVYFSTCFGLVCNDIGCRLFCRTISSYYSELSCRLCYFKPSCKESRRSFCYLLALKEFF